MKTKQFAIFFIKKFTILFNLPKDNKKNLIEFVLII